jgi:beta-glucuronidase
MKPPYPHPDYSMVFTLILALTITGSAAALTDTAPLIINADHRNTTNLNGAWDIIIDPYETGFYDYRYEESSDGYFKNTRPQNKGQ